MFMFIDVKRLYAIDKRREPLVDVGKLLRHWLPNYLLLRGKMGRVKKGRCACAHERANTHKRVHKHAHFQRTLVGTFFVTGFFFASFSGGAFFDVAFFHEGRQGTFTKEGSRMEYIENVCRQGGGAWAGRTDHAKEGRHLGVFVCFATFRGFQGTLQVEGMLHVRHHGVPCISSVLP